MNAKTLQELAALIALGREVWGIVDDTLQRLSSDAPVTSDELATMQAKRREALERLAKLNP